MPKIETFDAGTFWKNAYAHQRGKLLKKVSVPDDQIIEMVNKNRYLLLAGLLLDRLAAVVHTLYSELAKL